MHPVLDGLGIGDRHEAHADGRVLGGPDDDLARTLGKNLPAERLRPEPGQARQIMCVNDDVMKSDRHADSMRGIPGSAPAGLALFWPQRLGQVALDLSAAAESPPRYCWLRRPVACPTSIRCP